MRRQNKDGQYIYCKHCGAKLKRDHIGQYCGTRNCQWEYGLPARDDAGPYGKKPSPAPLPRAGEE